MVPSSSADIKGALNGQLKRLSRDYRRRNGDNVVADVLISFLIRDVYYTLSRWPGFRLFFVSLAVHYLAVYSILESLIELSLVVSATSTKAGRNFDNRFGCLPRFMGRFFFRLSKHFSAIHSVVTVCA